MTKRIAGRQSWPKRLQKKEKLAEEATKERESWPNRLQKEKLSGERPLDEIHK